MRNETKDIEEKIIEELKKGANSLKGIQLNTGIPIRIIEKTIAKLISKGKVKYERIDLECTYCEACSFKTICPTTYNKPKSNKVQIVVFSLEKT